LNKTQCAACKNFENTSVFIQSFSIKLENYPRPVAEQRKKPTVTEPHPR